MSAAAVIILRRKRLVRRFREAGALDPEHAVSLESLGERRTWIFSQMVSQRVFVPVSDNKHYLDEAAASDFLAAQRVKAWVVGGVLVIVFLVLWLLKIIGRR